MSAIGHADYQVKEAELVRLGVNSVEDVCLARVNREGFKNIQRISLKNKGNGNVTVTLKKRGQESTVVDENINALQVGGTDRFRGPFANRRVTPGSIVIEDDNAVVKQKVEDTDKDGVLWQTDGPAGPSYPIRVGSIVYEEGKIDFTFVQGVTLNVLADYKHTNWAQFDSNITFDLAAGGGARDYIILPDAADNYFDSLRDEEEWGIFAKRKTSSDPNTFLGLIVGYIGDESPLKLPLPTGEITGYPYHNA